jgi:hypothetical protein
VAHIEIVGAPILAPRKFLVCTIPDENQKILAAAGGKRLCGQNAKLHRAAIQASVRLQHVRPLDAVNRAHIADKLEQIDHGEFAADTASIQERSRDCLLECRPALP